MQRFSKVQKFLMAQSIANKIAILLIDSPEWLMVAALSIELIFAVAYEMALGGAPQDPETSTG